MGIRFIMKSVLYNFDMTVIYNIKVHNEEDIMLFSREKTKCSINKHTGGQ